MRPNFDLEYDQNNGVLAIRPSRNGRLKSLIKSTTDGSDRVWVFKDVGTWRDEHGDERIDHRARGVVNGTYEEGQTFLAMCTLLGLVVESGGFFVPFSNGQRRHGTFGDGKPFADYYESELKLMRWDLPTREQLKKLLG